MARPRPVLEDRIYLVTRRCTQRMFLLRPSDEVNQAVWYCFAEAANHCKMDVLWLMACSNHLHYGIDDTKGNYPEFLARFHKMLAKVLNCHHGRWGSFFEDEQTSMVHLADAAAVLDKMAYSLTNPVKDGLIKHAAEWPGATSLQHHLDNTQVVVQRPGWYFAEDTKMPATVTLRFKRPKPFRHLSQKNWAKLIRKEVNKREQAAADERRALGRRDVMGVEKIRAQHHEDKPKTPAPQREISPRVAAENKWRRIECIHRNYDWLCDYASALEDYRAGKRNVVFPRGTYQLRRDGHVRCAA